MNEIGQMRVDEDGREHLLVHYAVAAGKYVFRRNHRVPVERLACQPSVQEPRGWRRSDDVRAVTCPACKLDAGYQRVAAEVRAADPRWKG